ncbi:hypothetical protein Tco_1507968 [Tanacetum coccineum]
MFGPEVFGSHRPEVFGSSRPEVFGSHRPGVFGSPRPKVFGSSRPEVFGSHRPEVFGSPRPEVFGPEVFGSHRPEVFGSHRPEVFFDFLLTFLMAKKDMHTYVSHLKDAELKTLITTYDIPLSLRPRLPDSNFRMSILPAGDTAIGIYSRIFDSSGVRIPFSSFLLAVLKYFKVHISQLVPLGLSKVITFEVLCRSLNIEPTVTLFRVFQTLSKQGDWFSFAKRGGSAPVCMEVTKSGLKQWKDKFFLIDRRDIPFHMPWRHPDSCITDKIPTDFNQDHVDRLKAHIVKLRNIPEGVLVQSGLSRVWRNPMCDPVLRRSDNTVMSIHDFLCMPSLEKAIVREEPHELGTSILGRVADRTTPPAPASTAIPRASPEEIAVTQPDPSVLTKADHAAKRKTSTGPEISINTTKRTRLSQRVSRAGSSGLAAGDGVEQTDDVMDVEALADLSKGLCWAEELLCIFPAQDGCAAPWSERDTLAKEKAKIEEELKSQLEHRERQAEEIQDSITSFFQSDFTLLVLELERGLRMGRTDEEFRGLSQRVDGFIPDAKEKFDRVIAAFPNTTFPFLDKVSQHSQSSLQDIARLEPDRVTPSSQPSSATASLRTNTHANIYILTTGTFGILSTLST